MPEGLFAPLSGFLFDRNRVRLNRDRASASFSQVSFLKERSAQDIKRRLENIRRTFTHCLDLGAHTGQLTNHLSSLKPEILISSDLSEKMLIQAPTDLKVILDEEALPFKAQSFDLITSVLSLHWVNDIPGLFTQIHHCLKPDGLFLASFFGEGTLKELRNCFVDAEIDLWEGLTPRFSPMITIQDAGSLLQRAGFGLPVVDIDHLQITYPNPYVLLQDIRKMGEGNALYHRSSKPISSSLLTKALDLYQERHTLPSGKIYATFDILTVTGWTPHVSQQRPQSRGSGKISLESIF